MSAPPPNFMQTWQIRTSINDKMSNELIPERSLPYTVRNELSLPNDGSGVPSLRRWKFLNEKWTF